MNARNKGNNYEVKLCNELKEFFPDVVTSRSESKRLDDHGVDFCYTGIFNIQAKAVEKLRGGHHEILDRMPKEGVNVVFHKRNNKGTTVTMTKQEFYNILELFKDDIVAKKYLLVLGGIGNFGKM